MKLTATHKGIILIIAGVLILLNTLHALGWGLNIILIVASIAAIAWGFVLVDGPALVMKTFNSIFKKKHK